MNDPTKFPTASQAEALVAAYRDWIGDGDDDAGGDDAMFANLPGCGLDDDERCVTLDGFAVVAMRNRQDPAGTVYQLESYALDAELGAITDPEVIDPAAANPFGDSAHAPVRPTEGIDAFDAACAGTPENVTCIRPTVGRTVLYFGGVDSQPMPATVVSFRDDGPDTVPEVTAYVHFVNSRFNTNVTADLYDAGEGPPDNCRFTWMPFQMNAATKPA